MTSKRPLRVDVHTHFYPLSYIQALQQRNTVPYVRTYNDQLRLIILPGEDDPSTPSTARGRPLGADYHDTSRKIAFMDAHNIDISILSLANPWLDFLPADSAAAAARDTNDALQVQCQRYPGRLYAFGTLPLSGSASDIAAEIRRLQTLPSMRGVIMGTNGTGAGLDDPGMDSVWKALEETNTIAFVHPHYGLPSSVYGPRAVEYGHVLPLALGFPMETTIAVARMYLAGVWDRFPKLELLLAHSGGTLPFLMGRVQECITLDAHFNETGKATARRSLKDVLCKNIYLDAVLYEAGPLRAAAYAVDSGEGGFGYDRLLFGTDHPFFPPLERSGKDGEQWESALVHVDAIEKAFPRDDPATTKSAEAVLGGNAVRIFHLSDHVPGRG